MSVIYNIDDYRKAKGEKSPREQFGRFLEELGTWESPEDEMEYHRQSAKENAANMKAFFRTYKL